MRHITPPVMTVATCALLATGLVACTSEAPEEVGSVEITEGVEYGSSYVGDGDSRALVHVTTVDLTRAGVEVLYPGKVAHSARPTEMAEASEDVVGVVNGDFFNNSDDDHQHTFAPVGPMISGGQHLSAAVPQKQRQGPAGPDVATTQHVMGFANAAADITELQLEGHVLTSRGDHPLAGLNQHAIAVDGIGVFTPDWGFRDRQRALCGNDEGRAAECVDGVEVVITDNIVTEVNDSAGKGEIAANELVLVGREDGADWLSRLRVGDSADVPHDLVSDAGDFAAALGGAPLVMDGEALAGMPQSDPEPRTAVGYSADRSTLYMVVVDGRADHSAGVTLEALAGIAISLGAHGAMNLDGGGSSVMATVESEGAMEIRNDPSDGKERRVGNALAVVGVEPESTGDFALRGDWKYQGEHATDVRTLTIDGGGNVTYVGEGMAAAYTGTAEPGEEPGTYVVALEQDGDEATGSAPSFTLTLRPQSQDELLVMGEDGPEQVYSRDG